MNQIVTRGARIACVVLAAAAGHRIEAAPPSGPPYTSAKECATCHKTIYGHWSESEHSRSATRPSYLAALAAAVGSAADKDAVRRGCVWCHAPTSLVTGDDALKGEIAREGVSCDFCHTVADVDLDKPGHLFELQPGKVKRGPLEYAKSPFHLFLKAASVGEDTRIQPKESRTERFTVPLPDNWKAIVARLEYRDASDPTAGPKTTRVREERRDRGR